MSPSDSSKFSIHLPPFRRPPKIGIFDSGVGGLTVAQAIRRTLPGVPLIYFGDSARLPYGNKSKENILAYSRENIELLIRKGAEIIVIACNTSSAIALDKLRRLFNIPIIGVIDPGVMSVLNTLKEIEKKRKGRNKKTGVTLAATFRTVDSQIYKKKITSCHPGLSVYQVACPLLVPIIEEGLVHRHILTQVIKKYLSAPAARSQILLLGCTHYPLIKNDFKKTFPHLKVVDSAESTAYFLKKILDQGYLPLQEGLDVHALPLGSVKLPAFLPQKELPPAAITIYTNDTNEVFAAISKRLFPGVNVRRTSTS